MALFATHKEIKFGVGDEVKVHLKVQEGDKTRNQIFQGMVIAIRGSETGKSFTVRKVGAAKVGIEMIFPIDTPSMEKVEIVRTGTEGVKHAKLYYVRSKHIREVEKIYSRATYKNVKPVEKKKKVTKKTVEKTVSKKPASKKTSNKK